MVISKDSSFAQQLPVAPDHTALGAKLSNGDRQIFIDSVTRDLKSIEDAWCRHDEVALLECIHSLKGALFIVGEHTAANDCGVAEQGVHARGLDNCDADIERLKQALRHLLELYSGS